VRFAEARRPERRAIADGPLPGIALRALPAVEPGMGHGEFVRATLGRGAPVTSGSNEPGWEASAMLTKGGADAHLFLNFHHEPPLDLSGADCLVFDSAVPEGQQTRTALLVILHEEGGGDFLASTGRSLASAGTQRSVVPLDRFTLAGWAKDADGVLDLKRVSDVRIGWGGYLGDRDESVVFRVGTPQLGRIGGPTGP
jgi:hypothetical protein